MRRKTALQAISQPALWIVLVVAVVLLLGFAERVATSTETWKLFIRDRAYAPLADDFNCSVVWQGLGRLLTTALQQESRNNASLENEFIPSVAAITELDQITDLHVLFLGDSWAQRAAWAATRALHLCRRQLPVPLVAGECGFNEGNGESAHDVTFLSAAALGNGTPIPLAVLNVTAPFIRFHTHYMRRRFLVQAATTVTEQLFTDNTCRSRFRTTTFPANARCTSQWSSAPSFLSHQLPRCPCSYKRVGADDTNDTVSLAAIQLFAGMWDAHRPEIAWDLFSFHEEKVDWFNAQMALQSDRGGPAPMTWEANLARFRSHLAANFTSPMKSLRRRMSRANSTALPTVLLSSLPPVNCSGPKFYRTRGQRNPRHCDVLLHSIQDAINDSIQAVFDADNNVSTKPSALSPRMSLVDYHHNLYPSVCTMNDGVHLDTAKLGFSESPAHHRCSAAAHLLFWRHV